MTSGTVKTILVCTDSASPALPCPAGQAPAAVSAYVIDSANASYFDAVVEPFDYVSAGAFWSFAFVFTLSLYIGTRIYGYIINMTK